MKRPLLPLLASLALLTACQAPAAMAPAPVAGLIDARDGDVARLVVTPVAPAGRSLLAAPVKADIHHVVLTLFRAGTPETSLATLSVARADLGSSVTFGNLKRSTAYRIQAAAYRTADASDLISVPASSSVTVTLGADATQPTLARVPLKLVDEAGGLARVSAPALDIRAGGLTPRGVTTTLAGSTQGYLDATGTNALFSEITGLAADAAGNVYAAESTGVIRKVTPDGVVSTYAGNNGMYGVGDQDGPRSSATFNYPADVAIDADDGVMYVADVLNRRIRKITLADGTVSTLAGSGGDGSADGTGTAARFSRPEKLAIGPAGELFVLDVGNGIRKVTRAGVVSTVSTHGFYAPVSITVDGSGGLYVLDANLIYKVAGDGTATEFELSSFTPGASSVAATPDGTLYLASHSANDHVIERVSPTGRVDRLAGSAQGFVDGVGTSARFNYPGSLCVAKDGTLVVGELARIRKVY